MDIQKLENQKSLFKTQTNNLKSFFTDFIENFSALKNHDQDGLNSLNNYFNPLERENEEAIKLSERNISHLNEMQGDLTRFKTNYNEAEKLSKELEQDFYKIERNHSEMNKLIDNWENKIIQLFEDLEDIDKIIELANNCCKNSLPTTYTGREERQRERTFTSDEIQTNKTKILADQEEITCIKNNKMKEATKFIQNKTIEKEKDNHAEIKKAFDTNER